MSMAVTPLEGRHRLAHVGPMEHSRPPPKYRADPFSVLLPVLGHARVRGLPFGGQSRATRRW